METTLRWGLVLLRGGGSKHLIEAIKNVTNKQSISISELPYDSKMVIETDYSQSYVDEAKLSPKLEYEVDMRKEFGFKAADYTQAYFDLTGRELKTIMNNPKIVILMIKILGNVFR